LRIRQRKIRVLWYLLIPLDVAHDSGNDLARLYRFDLARDSEIIGIHICGGYPRSADSRTNS